VVDGTGEFSLRSLILEDLRSGARAEVPVAAVFVMIGAVPHTDWLAATLARDEQGYICTGSDLDWAAWSLERDPHFLETSLPGVLLARVPFSVMHCLFMINLARRRAVDRYP
jgi:thioredoxin reductase (NADPH)